MSNEMGSDLPIFLNGRYRQDFAHVLLHVFSLPLLTVYGPAAISQLCWNTKRIFIRGTVEFDATEIYIFISVTMLSDSRKGKSDERPIDWHRTEGIAARHFGH